MPSIHTRELPADALLGKYRENGAYTDCYAVDVGRVVSQAAYVEAFYTSAVFKIERQLLAWFVSKPATDHQASLLANGQLDAFSAWTVEGRAANQLLLCDFQGRTRSWLMRAPVDVNGSPGTRLYFGSAVVPVRDQRTGQATMGWVFRALLGFHKLYSRVLMRAAVARLVQPTTGDP
ncbi:hypothetical protein [Hydrogenophaga sp.]|uniref:hypothetical protein n=1 Tax=Hydrogenophaga sp. TaxID=1904254 RepID=UPI003D0DD86E